MKDKLTVFAHNACSHGPCPTVYKTEEGRYFVQGFITSSDIKNQINLPSDETLVEVDESLIQNIIRKG